MEDNKKSKLAEDAANESALSASANGAADEAGGILSVNGDTHPIPAAQDDAADESGGTLSVSGDTHPIPANNKAKSAATGG